MMKLFNAVQPVYLYIESHASNPLLLAKLVIQIGMILILFNNKNSRNSTISAVKYYC